MGVTLQVTTYIDLTRGNKMNVNNENTKLQHENKIENQRVLNNPTTSALPGHLNRERSSSLGDITPGLVVGGNSSNMRDSLRSKPMVQQTFHKSMFVNKDKTGQQSSLHNRCDGSSTQQMPTQTEESSKCEWQMDKVPSNRKRKATSPKLNDNVKKTTYLIPTHNRYDVLENEQADKQVTKEFIPKPEPIFVTGVIDIASLRRELSKFVNNDMYVMTTLKTGHIVKLMPKDIDTYKLIRENLIDKNINHYTYKLKSERAYRVVLRGLHASEDTETIKTELKELGHDTRQIINVKHRTTKTSLPIFYIDLEPKFNNKHIFNIKNLNHTKVSFEAPYKKKEIIQCKRCQRFGHTKNQCFRPYRCVKCAGDHPTSTCLKSPETEATCINCSDKHPASYKGCNKYKQYKEKILKLGPQQKNNKPPQRTFTNKEDNESKTFKTHENSTNRTYADATKARHNTRSAEHTVEPNSMTEMMEILLNKFQFIMSNMIDKMMDRMVQLISTIVTLK